MSLWVRRAEIILDKVIVIGGPFMHNHTHEVGRGGGREGGGGRKGRVGRGGEGREGGGEEGGEGEE